MPSLNRPMKNRKTAEAFSLLLLLSFFASCGSPNAICSQETCSGCCSADGQCVSGSANNACGGGGNSCTLCPENQTCAAGACKASTAPDGNGMPAADAGAPSRSDGGTPDGGDGGAGDGGSLTAPNETWTWVDFPNTACGNGSATGLGINLTDRSTDVLIYLEGGGACWNQLTCYTLQTATYFGGYKAADFNRSRPNLDIAYNRTKTNNPFRNASFVYIPYCTGDVHTGDAVASYGGHHKGAANIRAFIERLAPTFPGARRIWLAGVSAGGYGVQLNYHRFAEAFSEAEVHALADSAQMLNPSNATLLSTWLTTWKAAEPPGCTDCNEDFTRVPSWLSSTYPNRRFALLAYTKDSILSQFFNLPMADFEIATNNLLTSAYQGKSNLKYYVVEPSTPTHVMLDGLETRTVSGVKLLDWTTQWATGAASSDGGVWDNVRGP